MASNNIKKGVKKPVCQGCTQVFPDRMTLEKHMLVCIRPEEAVSFANMWKMGPVGGNPFKLTLRFTTEAEDNNDKLLPPSMEYYIYGDESLFDVT